MHRQRRVTELWSWLPAFRAVAEREHVKHAARDLHVTASALSRSIRLLEENIGTPLFDRVGRNLRLNQDGAALLVAVSDGMRRIDDGVARVTSTALTGTVRITCDGDQPLAFLWRALVRIRLAYPLLVPVIDDSGTEEVAARLLRGDVDVAFVSSPPENVRLHVEHVGVVTYGIYCGKGHALYSARSPRLDSIVAHPFLAPTPRSVHPAGDNWPPGVERTIEMYLPALAPAIAVCAGGHLLAVLPDAAVQEAKSRALLRRLPCDTVPASALYAVRRRSLGEGDRAAAVVNEMAAEFRAQSLAAGRTRSLRRKPDGGRR